MSDDNIRIPDDIKEGLVRVAAAAAFFKGVEVYGEMTRSLPLSARLSDRRLQTTMIEEWATMLQLLTEALKQALAKEKEKSDAPTTATAPTDSDFLKSIGMTKEG